MNFSCEHTRPSPAGRGIDLRAGVLLSLAVVVCCGIFNAMALYCDGAVWLLMIIQRSGFFLWDATRFYGMAITQAPVILGIRMGIYDINFLIWIYSASLVGLPAALWGISLVLHLRTRWFWPLTFAMAVAYLSCIFYCIGVHNILYGLTALHAALLIREKPLQLTHAVMLFLFSIGATRMYPSAIFLSALLAGMTVLKMREDNLWKCSLRMFFLLGSVAGCLLAMVFSYQATVLSEYPQQVQTIFSLEPLQRNPVFWFMLLMLVIYPSFLMVRSRRVRGVLLVVSILSGFGLLMLSELPKPWEYIAVRAVAGGGLFLVLFTVAVRRFLCRWDEDGTDDAYACVIPLACGIPLLVILLLRMAEFGRWAHAFEVELDRKEGVIAWNEVSPELRDPAYLFSSGWTHGALSILLRKGRSRSVILHMDSEHGWQPFDATAPDVRRHRLFQRSQNLF